jgi:hypothetical protein
MSFKLFNVLSLIVCWGFLYSPHSSGEIYQWVDSQGRLQFSDRSNITNGSSGYAHSANNSASAITPSIIPKYKNSTPKYKASKDLKGIAEKLKRDRLTREAIRDTEDKARVKKNNKRKKRLAVIEKKKLVCQKAQANQYLAFKKRTQRQGLMQMRKALANYEIKRKSRRKKCQ